MDILSSILNNIGPSASTASSSSGDLTKQFSSQLSNFLSQQNFNSGDKAQLIQQTGNNQYLIKLPSLSSIISGKSELVVKTDSPINNFGNFKVVPEGFSVNNINGSPNLKINGTIQQVPSGQTTNFTSNISLSQNIGADKAAIDGLNTARGASQEVNLTAKERPNLLNLSAYTNRVSSEASSITQNVSGSSSLKQDGVTSYNLTIKSLTYPSGKTVDLTQNINQSGASATGATSQIISGRAEFSAANNETIIFTKIGNFRVAGELSIPNGSNVNFVINNISNLKPEALVGDNIKLNLNSVKLALESEGSQLQNLLNNLQALPHAKSMMSSLFPNLSDKQSFARALWFLGGSSVGSADQWLGDKGQSFIKANFANSEQVFKGLNEVFTLLKSLNTNTVSNNNPDSWNTYLMPFYNDSNLEFASFYVQPRENGSENDKPQDRRFLVELEQEETGQIIIEGIIKEQDKKVVSLNLLISSQKGFEELFAEEIEVLFKDLSEAYGFSGNIQFINNIPSDYNTVLKQSQSDGIVI